MTSFKKTIISTLFALTASGLGGGLALADDHCSCDKACTEACAKGDTQSCKCKTCDCDGGKGCSHHQCGHGDGHKHEAHPSEKKAEKKK